MEEEQTFFDFREVLWKARRYKWLALFPIVLVLCCAWIYLMLTPAVYESVVVVAVADNSPVSPALGGIVRREQTEESRREEAQRVDGRIHSRTFLEAIVSRMGYAKNPELLLDAAAAARQWQGITAEDYATRMAVYTLGRKIIVTPVGETRIRIAATDHDPKAAAKLANMITDQLASENKASSINRATARGEFSSDQIAVYEERLRKSESALESYQRSMIGRRLTSNPINDTNFDGAKGVVADARAEMNQIRSRLQTDLSAWQNSGAPGTGPPAFRTSRTAELENRLSELEATYGLAAMDPKGSEVEGIKLKIGGVRQALYAEYQALADAQPNLSQGARDAAAGAALDRAELRSLKNKETRISRYTSDYSRRAVSQPTEQIESERLRADVEANRDLLQTLRKEATSSRISAALETSQLGMDLEVLETPQLPLRPVFPDPIRVMGMALLFGPLLGFGFAFIADRLGAALLSLEQAEKEIGAPVIGTIPRIEGWSQPGGYVEKYWPVLSIALVLFATAVFYTLHVTVLKQDTTESVQPKP
jgi:polysaccharide biosynthesis transport protein